MWLFVKWSSEVFVMRIEIRVWKSSRRIVYNISSWPTSKFNMLAVDQFRRNSSALTNSLSFVPHPLVYDSLPFLILIG